MTCHICNLVGKKIYTTGKQASDKEIRAGEASGRAVRRGTDTKQRGWHGGCEVGAVCVRTEMTGEEGERGRKGTTGKN